MEKGLWRESIKLYKQKTWFYLSLTGKYKNISIGVQLTQIVMVPFFIEGASSQKMEYYEERLSENLALNVQDKPEPMEIFTLLKENVSLNSRRNLKE